MAADYYIFFIIGKANAPGHPIFVSFEKSLVKCSKIQPILILMVDSKDKSPVRLYLEIQLF